MILEMLKEGIPVYRIAQSLDVNYFKVYKIAKREGIVLHKRGRFGDDCINRIAEIKKWREEGKTLTEIARILNVTYQVVSYALKKNRDKT